ncbi:hypothetical protein [Fimbriimonas ginsengisoli]|uniref:Uncharacterized protein n=1 Tax=Fimbriimonas ginsengisoli Gsoil 348 TaxID=661478 RepID=A0A068NV10_FIMGI|nr:hypothetical protein [Fimbriimonas ginsengisoli]AIE87202.1 hypothetical protein OP10G_3834 [Fimbriimonas ginsengisoli Gsoil 348]
MDSSSLNKRFDDVLDVLASDHPAKPYLIVGGIVGALGLFRNSLSGLVLLGLGGALVARGLDELRKTNDLHGGNHHGVNGPPQNL